MNVALGDTNGAGPMTLTLSPSTVPAGDVTFVVKNNGTIVHEAVVLKTNIPYDKIPIDNAGDPPAPVNTGANKVSEDTNIGETGDPDLEPGGTRTFTIKHMTAGNYVVVCNIADHYAMGMRAALTVTNPTTTVNVALGDTNGAGPMTLTLSPAPSPPATSPSSSRTTAPSSTKPSSSRPTSPTTRSPSTTPATHPPPSTPAPTKSAKTPTSAKPATPTSNPAAPAPSPSNT